MNDRNLLSIVANSRRCPGILQEAFREGQGAIDLLRIIPGTRRSGGLATTTHPTCPISPIGLRLVQRDRVISVLRLIDGSVKISASSKLLVENSETAAPFPPRLEPMKGLRRERVLLPRPQPERPPPKIRLSYYDRSLLVKLRAWHQCRKEFSTMSLTSSNFGSMPMIMGLSS
jgi:hypothetical protein